MKIKPFFPFLAALIGVVIYAYNAPQKSPDKGTTTTPKQYIELVEKNKAERIQREKDEATAAAGE